MPQRIRHPAVTGLVLLPALFAAGCKEKPKPIPAWPTAQLSPAKLPEVPVGVIYHRPAQKEVTGRVYREQFTITNTSDRYLHHVRVGSAAGGPSAGLKSGYTVIATIKPHESARARVRIYTTDKMVVDCDGYRPREFTLPNE